MKLGIAGFGKIVAEVLPVLAECGVAVSAVFATPRSREKASLVCSRVYTDYAQMLQEADLDAVYIALPNGLHYEFARQALLGGCHVIMEKPIAGSFEQAKALFDLADEKGLMLFEAICNLHYDNFRAFQRWLPRIGQIKLVQANYSQRSSRYDRFLAGDIAPAFDPGQCGGALMDLNLYNFHFLFGLFGAPKGGMYLPNPDRGIDTSGIALLDYGDFRANLTAAKDSASPGFFTVQGTKGYITQNGTPNCPCCVELHLTDGIEERLEPAPEHRLKQEFLFFRDAVDGNRLAAYRRLARQSLPVSDWMTRLRREAGIRFPCDP